MKLKVLATLLLVSASIARADPPRRDEGSFPRYPAAYYASAALAAGGLAFGFIAQGQSKRADSLIGATDAAKALSNAKAASATANVFYGLAGAALAYGIVLELLPPQIAERAMLTFHF